MTEPRQAYNGLIFRQQERQAYHHSPFPCVLKENQIWNGGHVLVKKANSLANDLQLLPPFT